MTSSTSASAALRFAKTHDLRKPLPVSEVNPWELSRELSRRMLVYDSKASTEDTVDAEDPAELEVYYRAMLTALVEFAIIERIEDRVRSLDEKLERFSVPIARRQR